jgi:hypothetical protein
MPSNVKKIAIAINKTIGATCVKKKDYWCYTTEDLKKIRTQLNDNFTKLSLFQRPEKNQFNNSNNLLS